MQIPVADKYRRRIGFVTTGAFACTVRQLDLEDLSRIHDVIGVDRLLDCTHHAHRFAVLGDQKVEFAAADAVLACAGAVE